MPSDTKPTPPKRKVPISWEALEDAFENNAPSVHSYLHLESGEVIRLVDGVADPATHQRIASDPSYLRIEAVSSREQYRWMERFIASIENAELRERLVGSITGKGAFRRFKDALMAYPVERERWFTFRSERLRACIEQWLNTHGIEPIPPNDWRVPSVEEIQEKLSEEERQAKRFRLHTPEQQRRRLIELIEFLPPRELEFAIAFLEFLKERKHLFSKYRWRSEEDNTQDDAVEKNTAVDRASERE
ncbi:MAG: UPF0158 family protein [Deltaproteobacteria bacterium]|nr:UPF0158 family protein [Deltaproteobacteria bacterium]